jgi:hypothetical protein
LRGERFWVSLRSYFTFHAQPKLGATMSSKTANLRNILRPGLAAIACLGVACSDSEDGVAETPEMPEMESAADESVDFDTTGDDTSACQAALFCDDFEAAATGAPPSGAWTASQTNGSVTVDTSRAFRGSQAVKATTLATAMTGQTYKVALIGLTGAPVVPVPNQAYYGRMMFYLESAPSASVHWTFIDTRGLVPGQDYTATYRYGGQLPVTDASGTPGNQLMANYDTTDFYGTPPRGPNTDCYQHAGGKPVPVGRWACAEWYFDGQNNQMRFWLDGAELSDLEIDGTGEGCVAQDPGYTWVAPTFSRIDVGWESYQADDERSIWIDDVVISSSQVGCPVLGN